MSDLLWGILTVQAVLGFIDIVVHHEFLERLAWRSSARGELQLHGLRNLLYTVVYLCIGWAQLHGAWVWLLTLVLGVELLLTFWDWVTEDASRNLAPSERILHGLLTMNYGILLAVLTPTLWQWWQLPSQWVQADNGLWAVAATLFGVVAGLLGVKDLLAARRLGRWEARARDGAELVACLGEPQTLLVTGATGLIGRRLVQALLAAQHRVIVLTRRPAVAAQLGSPLTIVESLRAIPDSAGVDGIVHLAGEPVAARPWSRSRKRKLLTQRVRMVQEVGELARRLRVKPRVWVNASAVSWYSDSQGAQSSITEHSPPGEGYAHELCDAMEQAALAAPNGAIRLVNLRLGLVLSREGGLLAQLLTSVDLYCGALLGNGQQWQSWVHRDDVVRAIAFCLVRPQLAGAVNVTAPEPVQFAALIAQLAIRLHRRVLLRVPARWLRFVLRDMADELILLSQRVQPHKLLQAGFEFRYAKLQLALAQELD